MESRVFKTRERVLALTVVFKSEYMILQLSLTASVNVFFHVNISKGHKASVLFYTLPLFAIMYDKEIMECMLLDMLTEGTHSHVLLFFLKLGYIMGFLNYNLRNCTGISHVYYLLSFKRYSVNITTLL